MSCWYPMLILVSHQGGKEYAYSPFFRSFILVSTAAISAKPAFSLISQGTSQMLSYHSLTIFYIAGIECSPICTVFLGFFFKLLKCLWALRHWLHPHPHFFCCCWNIECPKVAEAGLNLQSSHFGLPSTTTSGSFWDFDKISFHRGV